MKNFLKSVWHKIQLFDGIWSLPLSIFICGIFGSLLQLIYGYQTGTYDMGVWQALFMAVVS